ncbi:N-acetylglucosamine-6-phosphate deacetylase [Citricoccus sp.]|uniref:N-acetylglucosamine-6-phosphate deacetylase n=1 Tax=Citricoccus sp. TaxID=1978372 RepID=UPI0028BE32C7|nr:N-acetylglucosamine-6-phosphate deacetylase [Citricoccus sp.]
MPAAHPGSAPGPRTGRLITPGLVDQHCHGLDGVDFATAPVHQVREALRELARRGVTRVVASLPTLPAADLLAAVRRLAPLVWEGTLAGLHLEGPFLSRHRCGAQSAQDVLEPGSDRSRRLLESLVQAGRHDHGGPDAQAIVAMTYAPELDGAEVVERTLFTAGVLPSPGHTDATEAEFITALQRWTGMHTPGPGLGGTGQQRRPAVTHLFNAMPGFHHRAPGPVPAALRAAARGDLRVELVADGLHVDPGVVLDVLRLAPGAVCVVSDASAATDAPAGAYTLGAVAIESARNTGIPENGISAAPRVAGQPTLASGAVTLDGALRNLLAWGVPPELAVPAVSTTPALTLPPARRASGWVEWEWEAANGTTAPGPPAVVIPPGAPGH